MSARKSQSVSICVQKRPEYQDFSDVTCCPAKKLSEGKKLKKPTHFKMHGSNPPMFGCVALTCERVCRSMDPAQFTNHLPQKTFNAMIEGSSREKVSHCRGKLCFCCGRKEISFKVSRKKCFWKISQNGVWMETSQTWKATATQQGLSYIFLFCVFFSDFSRQKMVKPWENLTQNRGLGREGLGDCHETSWHFGGRPRCQGQHVAGVVRN